MGDVFLWNEDLYLTGCHVGITSQDLAPVFKEEKKIPEPGLKDFTEVQIMFSWNPI